MPVPAMGAIGAMSSSFVLVTVSLSARVFTMVSSALISLARPVAIEVNAAGFRFPVVTTLATRLFTLSADFPVRPSSPPMSRVLTSVFTAPLPRAATTSPPVARVLITVATPLSMLVASVLRVFGANPEFASSREFAMPSPMPKLLAAVLAIELMPPLSPPDVIPPSTSPPEIAAPAPPTAAPVSALLIALSTPAIPVFIPKLPTPLPTIGAMPAVKKLVSPALRGSPPVRAVPPALANPAPAALAKAPPPRAPPIADPSPPVITPIVPAIISLAAGLMLSSTTLLTSTSPLGPISWF